MSTMKAFRVLLACAISLFVGLGLLGIWASSHPAGVTATALEADALDDFDGDGCADSHEEGADVRFGGLRDRANFWDFFDTPDAGGSRDQKISAADIWRVASRFASQGNPAIDPVSLPGDLGYHPAFDRSPAPLGSDPWDLGPADGVISAQDIASVAGQFGHRCTGAVERSGFNVLPDGADATGNASRVNGAGCLPPDSHTTFLGVAPDSVGVGRGVLSVDFSSNPFTDAPGAEFTIETGSFFGPAGGPVEITFFAGDSEVAPPIVTQLMPSRVHHFTISSPAAVVDEVRVKNTAPNNQVVDNEETIEITCMLAHPLAGALP